MQTAKDDADAVPALHAAERWLRDAAADLRTERFEPLVAQTKEIWRQLRAQSSVELVDVVLAGSATQRRVKLSVTVDGVEGAALGVMSQGELHSLALSLFFPRATLSESPFRFVVIDDPVQSMDPVRVDGLARVLEDVARKRQVVVFSARRSPCCLGSTTRNRGDDLGSYAASELGRRGARGARPCAPIHRGLLGSAENGGSSR